MAKDILLDTDDDLLIEGGDLVADDSAEQEVGLILRTSQGDWRNSPLTGFGVARRTRNAINPDAFARDLSSQLELDGFAEHEVNLATDGQLTINARRNE